MREILFRGKRIDNGEWVFGSLLVEGDDRKIVVPKKGMVGCFVVMYPIDPKTVGQYTGLTIKGEKLFEHDQIRFRETVFDDWEYGTVVWCGKSDYPAFDVEPWIDCDCNGLSYIKMDCEVEIVGNKWDNPELLEVED